MSKNLARLLDQPERVVTKAINKLESLNGYHSEDARLLAENSQAVRTKIAELGLDPDDTTGEELYHALLSKFEKDNALIDKAVGLSTDSTLGQRIDRALQLVGHLSKSSETWFLKYSAAKDLLRDQPPRKLMKLLNYRSVESLLKREDISTIYLLLPFVESSSWQKSFAKKTANLNGTDYELRQPQLTKISHRYLTDAPQLLSNNLVGAIALNPSAGSQGGSVLTIALLLADGLGELTHSEAVSSLAHLHPALMWWEQAKNLMAVCGEDIVSLNLKDAAGNHLSQADYQQRSSTHGRESLWNELTSRYNKQVSQLEESVANMENVAGQELNKLTPKQAPKNLALEYAEAIANEF